MVDDSKSRRALHAYVSDSAHDQWHDFCAEQGISVSALLEQLAPRLDDVDATARGTMREGLELMVVEARKLDAQRRRRRR